MNALLERTLMINLICSTMVFYVGARIYVLPRVRRIDDPGALRVPRAGAA